MVTIMINNDEEEDKQDRDRHLSFYRSVSSLSTVCLAVVVDQA